MSKVFVSDINLSNIADAIRTKNGAQTQYYPREMAAAIMALDAEQHKPIQVNIQQSANQTIKVKVKQKELNNTTVNANVELPETIQLEATIVADEGHTPGILNQSLVNAEWGDTVTFSATQATLAAIPVNLCIIWENVSSEDMTDLNNVDIYDDSVNSSVPMGTVSFTAVNNWNTSINLIPGHSYGLDLRKALEELGEDYSGYDPYIQSFVVSRDTNTYVAGYIIGSIIIEDPDTEL